MSFFEKIQSSLATVLLLLLSCCLASQAQNAVLTGSINQSEYRPRIVTQDAYLSQVPVSAPTAYSAPVSAVPVTSVRVPAAAANARAVRYADRPVRYVDRPVVKTVYVQDNRTFFQKHPKVKAATIGAGVGAGVGALTGLVTHRGVMRGALIGGGTGAGVGLVRSSEVMKRHPIMRNVATGSLVGLGLGAAASRGHRKALMGTGIGAAVGLGASLLNGEFK